MKRRAFIAGLGSAAAWPLVAGAQDKVARVGVLLLDNADAALSASFLAALRDELRKAGYVEQQNVRIDLVSAAGKIDQLPELAGALVALRVDLIIALLTPCAHAAQQATREIPIVVYAGDPVGTSLVASLARPGGNITGVSAMTSELHGPVTAALQRETRTIPIVFAVASDPVGSGFAASLARRGGNITGFSIAEPSLPGKWLELLTETAPGLRAGAAPLAF
jgi:putative tryptophan/tyrosine transport system substrate-binding protein